MPPTSESSQLAGILSALDRLNNTIREERKTTNKALSSIKEQLKAEKVAHQDSKDFLLDELKKATIQKSTQFQPDTPSMPKQSNPN
eukprot:11668463-Ditylum_brightwellii.AAC.2